MADQPVQSERRGAAPLRRRRRLLLVDEDPWCRGIADGVLRSRGYRVFCTGDTRTAIELAGEFLPDLVLADVGLALVETVPLRHRRKSDGAPPRLQHGYAILRPLVAGRPLASAPVVLNAAGRESEWSDAPRFDLPDHVPKPFTPEALLEKVAAYLPGPIPAGVTRLPAAARGESWKADETVMEGSIDFVGVPAVLEMLHANQLTGVCTLRAPDGSAGEIGFEDGEIVGAATSDARGGLDAMCRMLSWRVGRFAFALARPVRGPSLGYRFEGLMLDCMRRVDEESQAAARSGGC